MHFLEWLCSAHSLDQREHSEWLSFIKQILWFNNEHFFSLLQEVFIMWAFCFFLSPSFSLTSLRKAENAANNRVTVYKEVMIHGTCSCVPYTYWTPFLHFLFCGTVSLQSSSVNGPCRLSLYSVSLWWRRLIILLGKHSLTQFPWLQPQGSQQLEQLSGSESRLSLLL